MSTRGGTPLVGRQDAYFVIDTHNIGTGVSPIGCGGYNGSTDGVTNQISFNKSLFINGLKLSNKTYYTGGAKTYPEGNYGTDGLGFLYQGIHTGYNIRGSYNLFGAGRGITMHAWNNDTDSWVADSYFVGSNSSGYHTYDNYGGSETGYANNLGWLVRDYSRIRGRFPNCTFILIGSHAADQYDTNSVNMMMDLGAPSYVSGWNPSPGRPEWILVGRPGLGAGNAYGWAYENYSVDTSAVAHLNFGLEIKNPGELEFDGTDDYMTFTGITGHQLPYGTLEAWCYPTAVNSDRYVVAIGDAQVTGASRAIRANGGSWSTVTYGSSTEDWSGIVTADANQWQHVVFVWFGTTCRFYKNGVEYSTTKSGLVTPQGTLLTVGTPAWSWGMGNSSYNHIGKIGSVKAYSRGLTATEILNNYNRTKSQYGL
jgi:hypothetical protein